MIEYKEIRSKVPFKKTCDKCGFSVTSDDENFVDWQEFFSIRFTGGYGSVFGDMAEVELDLCQHCFNELLGKFVKVKQFDISGCEETQVEFEK